MSINLLELMQSAIGKQLVERVAGITGADAGGAQKAVGTMLPTLLGGLISKSSTPEGADQLAGVIGQADGTIIDNIDKIFEGADGGSDRLTQMGQGLTSGLLGDKVDGILDIISKTSGLGKGGTGSLMNLIIPLVFSVLGKQTGSLGLNPAGIAKLLADQSGFLKGLLPKGMAGLLGLPDEYEAPDGILDSSVSAVTGVAGGAKDAVTGVSDSVGDSLGKAADKTGDMASSAGHATTEAAKKSGGFIKLLLPIIILGALAFLAWKFVLPMLNKGPAEAPSVEAIETENALDSMKGVLNETTSTLTGITDEASATAAVPKIEELTGKVEAINGLASGLPEGMTNSIGTAIKGSVGKIDKASNAAYAIPGVQGIIEPKLEEFVKTLNRFGQKKD